MRDAHTKIQEALSILTEWRNGMRTWHFQTTVNKLAVLMNEAAEACRRIPVRDDNFLKHHDPSAALNTFCYELPGDAEKVTERAQVFGTEAAINRLAVLLKHSTMTMQIGEANCNLFVHGNFASIGQLSSILGQNEEQRRAINSMKAELERSRNRSVIDACNAAQEFYKNTSIQDMDKLVRWQTELDYGGEKLTIVHSDKFADGCYYIRHSFGDGSVAESVYPAYNHLGALLLAKNADLNYAVPLEWFS